jgi:uroporphyrinogen decarboxylase
MAVSEAIAATRFMRAVRRERTDATPVWFMRQAGRYMAEYRAIRVRHSLLEICAQPELAAEVTMQPVRRLGVDAAILFADILLPLPPMGLQLEFAAGEGPVIHNPVRTAADVEVLRTVEPRESLASVLETVRLVRAELNGRIPLIGFAGAPFTVASYAIEGGSSRQFVETKRLMYGDEALWHRFMSHVTDTIVAYLTAQVEAGADVIQLFDSWAGILSPQDYERYALPYSQRILRALQALEVPSIHFGVGTATILHLLQQAGGDVIGLDWRVPLDEGWERLGAGAGVQGNLDPTVLFAPVSAIRPRVEDVLRRAGGRPGHIFNLGHGILPGTPVEHVKAVVEMVHEISARGP